MNKYRFSKEDHVHLFEGRPMFGTSTVTGVLNKPGLTYWASSLAVGCLGWLNPRKHGKADCLQAAEDALAKIKEMDGQEWMAKLNEAYRAHATNLKTTAQAGTDLHAELEAYVKDQMIGQKGIYSPQIDPFIEWAEANVERFLWSEAHCYSEALWVGGITDIGARMKDGSTAILDAKSAREAYDSHFIQIGGYALQIEENGLLDANGNSLKIEVPPIDTFIVIPFGTLPVTPAIKTGIGQYKEGFRSALQLHKLLNAPGQV